MKTATTSTSTEPLRTVTIIHLYRGGDSMVVVENVSREALTPLLEEWREQDASYVRAELDEGVWMGIREFLVAKGIEVLPIAYQTVL